MAARTSCSRLTTSRFALEQEGQHDGPGVRAVGCHVALECTRGRVFRAAPDRRQKEFNAEGAETFLCCHSPERGNPFIRPRGGPKWIPAFAGITEKNTRWDAQYTYRLHISYVMQTALLKTKSLIFNRYCRYRA